MWLPICTFLPRCASTCQVFRYGDFDCSPSAILGHESKNFIIGSMRMHRLSWTNMNQTLTFSILNAEGLEYRQVHYTYSTTVFPKRMPEVK